MDIVILDTGCANLSSVQNAVKKIGYSSLITSNPSSVLKARKIFLPGVGTASAVMKSLFEKKLIEIVQNIKIPILGICLGMQLFCSFSSEGKGVKTLGIIKSSVSRLQSNNLPLPHMGWNNIIFDAIHPLLKNIKNQSKFYFVHSYFVPITKYTLATSHYEISFSSIIQKKNFFGVQFHPEKSGDIGLQFLKNFIEI